MKTVTITDTCQFIVLLCAEAMYTVFLTTKLLNKIIMICLLFVPFHNKNKLGIFTLFNDSVSLHIFT